MKLDFPCSIRPFIVHWLGFVNITVVKETDGNFTFECKFFFKADRIIEGDSKLLLIFASEFMVTVQPVFAGIFGSDTGSLEGKSFSKRLNKSITSLNFLSTSSDVLSPASAADFNASSAAISTLFRSHWHRALAQVKQKDITFSTGGRNLNFVRGLWQKIGIKRLVP